MKLISYSLIVITLLLSLSCSRILYAYEIDGRKWIGGTTDFYVDIQGIAPSGITWNTAFIAAMNDWSEETLFDFNLIQQAIDPCLSDGLNGVEFTSDLCGSEFGERTLAVTLNKFRSQILGSPAITEADIVINQSKEFFENEFKAKIEVIKAQDSSENKANQAVPGKVAILVE